MKLIECYIENFGKISKQKFVFTDGLNCIIEDNGSGKTTLAVFIKVMLYGMSDTKKASLEENDRKHYLPWQGGVCGGSLTFSANGKTYRVERSFSPKAADDSYTLYDTSTGRVSNDFPEGLGEGLFGIDADGFERTVFLSERALTPKSDNKSISAKLSDLVGCDGDIGGMDEALKALEEKRKFYYKKGGSGEIADTKAKIDAISRRLSSLDEIEKGAVDSRKRLSDITKQIDSARAEAGELMKLHESLTLQVAEQSLDKQYNELKKSVAEWEKKRSLVADIFGAEIPSHNEIDLASYKSVEAKGLEDSSFGNLNPELGELAAKFDGRIERTQIESAREAAIRLGSKQADESNPDVKRARRIFAKRVPTEDEILNTKRLIGEKAKISPVSVILPAILAAVCIICSALELVPLPAGIVGVLISAIILGIAIGKAKRDRKKEISDFFISVSGVSVDNPEEISARLEDMQRLLPVMTDGMSRSDSEEMKGHINLICSLFPGQSAEQIIKEYDRYTELLAEKRFLMSDRSRRAERATALRAEAEAFIKRFNTKTSNPFDELRSALNEYNRISLEITHKREEMAKIESRLSLAEGAQRIAESKLAEVNAKRHENEELVARLSREYTLTERKLMAEEEELDEREELLMQKSELEEIYQKHTENYDTVLLTKKYLAEARDNMTAKYLGKTKAGFIRYTERIGGISGESFEMDTDFGITKQEGASTRPTDAYSRGTRDLFNLAARLALVDSLYEKESPFIILDDPFTAFDDKRTAAAVKSIREIARDRQIIYFTCSKSRGI